MKKILVFIIIMSALLTHAKIGDCKLQYITRYGSPVKDVKMYGNNVNVCLFTDRKYDYLIMFYKSKAHGIIISRHDKQFIKVKNIYRLLPKLGQDRWQRIKSTMWHGKKSKLFIVYNNDGSLAIMTKTMLKLREVYK